MVGAAAEGVEESRTLRGALCSRDLLLVADRLWRCLQVQLQQQQPGHVRHGLVCAHDRAWGGGRGSEDGLIGVG